MAAVSVPAQLRRRTPSPQPEGLGLRIAVPNLEGRFWTVGPIHFQGLLRAIRDTYADQVGLFAFGAALDGIGGRGLPVDADGAVPYRYPRRWSASWAENWMSRHLRARD